MGDCSTTGGAATPLPAMPLCDVLCRMLLQLYHGTAATVDEAQPAAHAPSAHRRTDRGAYVHATVAYFLWALRHFMLSRKRARYRKSILSVPAVDKYPPLLQPAACSLLTPALYWPATLGPRLCCNSQPFVMLSGAAFEPRLRWNYRLFSVAFPPAALGPYLCWDSHSVVLCMLSWAASGPYMSAGTASHPVYSLSGRLTLGLGSVLNQPLTYAFSGRH